MSYLVLSSSLSSLLSSGLVEPGSDSSLPVLVEVGVGQNVVSFANHGFLVRALKIQKNESLFLSVYQELCVFSLKSRKEWVINCSLIFVVPRFGLLSVKWLIATLDEQLELILNIFLEYREGFNDPQQQYIILIEKKQSPCFYGPCEIPK